MYETAWTAFIAAAGLAFIFFFFSKRRFDLLTIAYIGAVFYFSPLVWGKVLQSSPEFDSSIPVPVYLIATAYIIALVAAGLLPQTETKVRPGRSLSEWYLILAIAGLVGSLISSRGAIIDGDKVKAMAQIGYLFTCFEISAGLACVSSALERRWWILASGALLLAQLSGLVILEATVNVEGCVESVKVLRSRHLLLDKAAKDALMQWRYSPLVLNRIPTPFVLTVTFNFSTK